MAIFQRLNRERGITVIFVTHEPDIAAHTGRIIHVRDGRVTNDEAVETPVEAATVLERLPAEGDWDKVNGKAVDRRGRV